MYVCDYAGGRGNDVTVLVGDERVHLVDPWQSWWVVRYSLPCVCQFIQCVLSAHVGAGG